ncbi:MAG: WGR domain-containing protein [Planctomycetes bacterium]|nr:WGR domain-containing protein [Planctomycetota bacterium]
MEVRERQVTYRWGRIGTAGRSKTKALPTAGAAQSG